MRLRSAAAQGGKGRSRRPAASRSRRHLVSRPLGARSCSGRPPSPSFPLSASRAGDSSGAGDGGRGVGRPGECERNRRERGGRGLGSRRPVRGRGAGAARGVLSLFPPLPPPKRLRSDWQSRTAPVDWSAPGEAGEGGCALIGYRGADRGEDRKPNRFPRADRGWGGGGWAWPGGGGDDTTETRAVSGLVERLGPPGRARGRCCLTAGEQGRVRRPSRGCRCHPGQPAGVGGGRPDLLGPDRGFATGEFGFTYRRCYILRILGGFFRP